MNREQSQIDPLSAVVKEEPNDEINDKNESLAAATKRIEVPIIFDDTKEETLVVKEEPDEEPPESYKLVKRHIDDLPKGHPLETPLHARRKREWQPSVLAAPTPPPRSLSPLPLVGDGVNHGEVASTSPESSPSPTAYLKCGQASTPPATPSTSSSMPPPPPRQNLRDNQEAIGSIINYGSDGDTDESDEDEDEMAWPMLPRLLRVMMTPWNQDKYEDEEGGAGAAPAADPAPGADPPLSATEQPLRLFDFQWREFPNPSISPELRRETFSQNNVGPTSPHVDPYDIFVAIWDRQFMENIASETNRYAQQVADQMFENHSFHPNSRISQWRDTTADELYVYLGLVLAMGVVVKPRLEDYWSGASDIFCTPGFRVHMSRNRFKLLNRCLHFVNNEDMCALDLDGSEARLFKIRPLLTHLNLKFQLLYIPSQNISLDESLLMWKSWKDVDQLIPSKAANRGIKTYEICESRTGYLWRFEVHAHSRSAPKPPEPENPLEKFTPATVLRLTQGLEHKGYTLWMDNFYSSPVLARRLKSLGFDCVGTLRTDRQFHPEALYNLIKSRMRVGQISGLTSGDVDVMVWRDVTRVAMISTYHGNAIRTIRGSTKPILIHDYSIMMGGVDKKDQILATYPIERKRTRVWYKKLFRRLLNVSVFNSFVIHQQNSISSSSLSHRNFRSALISSILSKHGTPSSSSSFLPRSTPQNIPIDLSHRLAFYPTTPGRKQRMRRLCVVCKKMSQMFCVGCNKTICLDPCFLSLHN